MRRTLNFPCEGANVAATLDEASGTTGLLIVSGGNEIRIGAHRGMAQLGADVANVGYPVFRFDRRGIGDSEGENGGFRSSAPDIVAAIEAFKAACPHVTKIVCFGNCDAATALVLHETLADGLVLANPWVIESLDDLPPPAAIKAHYRARLRDPKAWLGLFTGAINIRKVIVGLRKVATQQTPSSLSESFATGLASVQSRSTKITILIAIRDATAIAFADEWAKPHFDIIDKARVNLIKLDSGSHSFASDADYQVLKEAILAALSA
jgi:exosortase A-associated hydrolase 1